ncbi:hypothetical protein Ancab_010414, partial [Ancistrocladus abbreviatus]
YAHTSLHHLPLFPTLSSANNRIYDVVDFGAKPDGKTSSSSALLSAWAAACGSATPCTIHVPAGRFLIGSATVFSGKICENTAITFRIDGVLVAPSDYRVLGSLGTWILFETVTEVTISGGILDGQGHGLWACKASGGSCPTGATASNCLGDAW